MLNNNNNIKMYQQQTSPPQCSQDKELRSSITSIDEEWIEELQILKKNETTKKQTFSFSDSINTKSLKTAWDPLEMQTHTSELDYMRGNAGGMGRNLHCIDAQPTLQHDLETLDVQRREPLCLSPRKKTRHDSLRGHFHTPVKSRRKSTNSRKSGSQKWNSSSEIMDSIFGTKNQSQRKQSKVAVSLTMDPAQIATDLLLKQSKKELGFDLREMIGNEDGKDLFKEKMSSFSSDELKVIACELFSCVGRSAELMKVACSVNRESVDKRNTLEIIIDKTHQMVECSTVCLYLIDKSNLIIALTDDSAIFVDARLPWTSLVGRCAFTNKVVKQCGQL
jgi:hypothetical protein